ncbi:MAG: acetate kinase, partial [Bacteroidales bacterium]|nr:acetate kinase [Bacteroidales bacterium]
KQNRFMKVLVVNCGSSSVKFQLYKMPDELLLIYGKAERNKEGNTDFSFQTQTRSAQNKWEGFSFSENFKKILNELTRPENECLATLDELNIVGHRLIHGGDAAESQGAVEITDELISYMESCVSLAPLHYPANLEGIRTVAKLLPEVLQAGIFDTAFHQTLPPKAYLYGIPLDLYKKHNIRRLGFHGTSHKYTSLRTCRLTGLKSEKSKIVSCHLGNGASVAAIKNGKSVDTSMGMTPVEGLLMGTRSGDIDAGVLVYLQENFKLSLGKIQHILNHEGGLLGLSGVSSDYRAVEEAAVNGNLNAQTALDVYHYRVKKYIGAYAAAMGGIDALAFTGGIGENSYFARKQICSDLGFLGIRLSEKLNKEKNGKEAIINKENGKVNVLIIPANEELMIAREIAGWAKSKV